MHKVKKHSNIPRESAVKQNIHRLIPLERLWDGHFFCSVICCGFLIPNTAISSVVHLLFRGDHHIRHDCVCIFPCTHSFSDHNSSEHFKAQVFCLYVTEFGCVAKRSTEFTQHSEKSVVNGWSSWNFFHCHSFSKNK